MRCQFLRLFKEQFHQDIIFPQGSNCSLYQVRVTDFSPVTHHRQAWLITLFGKVLMCVTQCFSTANYRLSFLVGWLVVFIPLTQRKNKQQGPAERILSPLSLWILATARRRMPRVGGCIRFLAQDKGSSLGLKLRKKLLTSIL